MHERTCISKTNRQYNGHRKLRTGVVEVCRNVYYYKQDNGSPSEYWINFTLSFVICSKFIFIGILCLSWWNQHMTPWLNNSAEIVSCNIAAIFYYHTVVIQHLVLDTLYQTGDFLFIIIWLYHSFTDGHLCITNKELRYHYPVYNSTHSYILNILKETTFLAWRHVIFILSFIQRCHVTVFLSHSHDMTPWLNSSAEIVFIMVHIPIYPLQSLFLVFFWPLYCLFVFDIQILITRLVSSNLS
jgi:hypothetical protein